MFTKWAPQSTSHACAQQFTVDTTTACMHSMSEKNVYPAMGVTGQHSVSPMHALLGCLGWLEGTKVAIWDLFAKRTHRAARFRNKRRNTSPLAAQYAFFGSIVGFHISKHMHKHYWCGVGRGDHEYTQKKRNEHSMRQLYTICITHQLVNLIAPRFQSLPTR